MTGSWGAKNPPRGGHIAPRATHLCDFSRCRLQREPNLLISKSRCLEADLGGDSVHRRALSSRLERPRRVSPATGSRFFREPARVGDGRLRDPLRGRLVGADLSDPPAGQIGAAPNDCGAEGQLCLVARQLGKIGPSMPMPTLDHVILIEGNPPASRATPRSMPSWIAGGRPSR